MTGNHRDYPGADLPPIDHLSLMKTEQVKRRVNANPSPAQIKQRHKWMLTGTLTAMHSRLNQLLSDKMIPHGRFRSELCAVRMSIALAQKDLKEVELRLTEYQFIDLGYANGWVGGKTPKIALECARLNHRPSSSNEGKCLTKYYCEICGYSYSIDSSD